VFDELDAEFHFETDVCALASNAKCRRFFTPADDGLTQPWTGVCWMNPPYGRTIGQWIEKAYRSALDGATVVCLVPARTDTAWWHDFAAKSADIRYLRGRLRFGDAENGAPFPSAIVVFSPETISEL
jgi:phage N-6-adenine-methyltransferase